MAIVTVNKQQLDTKRGAFRTFYKLRNQIVFRPGLSDHPWAKFCVDWFGTKQEESAPNESWQDRYHGII